MPRPQPSALDPLQFLRNALNTFETKANSAANRQMTREGFNQVAQAVMKASLGARKLADKWLNANLHRLNIPTHDDVKDLAQRLQRVEDMLEQLPALIEEAVERSVAGRAPAPVGTRGAMPPRTRKPALAAPGAAAAAAAANSAAFTSAAPAPVAPPAGPPKPAPRRARARKAAATADSPPARKRRAPRTGAAS